MVIPKFKPKSRIKLKKVERTFQKNRFFNKPKNIKLRGGDSALINLKETRLELSQIGKIKRILRKLIHRHKTDSLSKRHRVWYFGKTYFYLQKKSKNSRMGKGKGSIDRKVLKLKKNFVLFEFCGFSLYKLKWFVNKINKKLNFKFTFVFKRLIINNSWYSPKNYTFFYKKYLLN